MGGQGLEYFFAARSCGLCWLGSLIFNTERREFRYNDLMMRARKSSNFLFFLGLIVSGMLRAQDQSAKSTGVLIRYDQDQNTGTREKSEGPRRADHLTKQAEEAKKELERNANERPLAAMPCESCIGFSDSQRGWAADRAIEARRTGDMSRRGQPAQR